MTRSLPPRPNLDYLKREARRLLRAVKDGRPDGISMVRALPGYANATSDEIAASATLLDVQYALARDYGFAGWKDLRAYVQSRTPALRRFRPVLGIRSFAAAVEHYRDWLGFTLDWEWREAPGRPAIASFSRDDASFMVNEFPDAPGPAELHLDVKNLDALVEEWDARRPGAAKVRIGPPGEFPEARIADPWGNVICFEGKDEADDRKRRDAVRPKMRRYIEAQLNAGREIPTPEEVRDAVGPPLTAAVDVLNEFPEYAVAFEARQANKDVE